VQGQHRIHFGLNVHVEFAETKMTVAATCLDVQSIHDGLLLAFFQDSPS
jgi:hypothetical protein